MSTPDLDHHRPVVHVRPRDGWVNDPNGPILVDRTWHLYFQFKPDVESGPISWGHATSTDLVEWTVHPPAIHPSDTGLDTDGVWSGNVVEADGWMYAFHSGFLDGRDLQTTLRRVSTDGGATYGTPIPAIPDRGDGNGLRQLRDPFVWREGDVWLMALGASRRDREPAVLLFESDDLETWREAGSLVADTVDSELADMWECPQVIDVDGVRAVLVAAWLSGRPFGPVLALTGPTGARDYAPAIAPFDHGSDFYAPSVFRDGDGGPRVWGWMPEAREQSWWAAEGWAGMLTLPRAVSGSPDGTLLVRPAPEVDGLRDTGLPWADGAATTVPGAFEAVITPDAGATTVTLRCGDDERLELRIDVEHRRLELDRTASSTDARATRDVVRVDDVDLEGELRLFVDGSAVELFTASGTAVSARVYPVAQPPWTLDAVGARDVRIWSLRPSVRDASIPDGSSPA